MSKNGLQNGALAHTKQEAKKDHKRDSCKTIQTGTLDVLIYIKKKQETKITYEPHRQTTTAEKLTGSCKQAGKIMCIYSRHLHVETGQMTKKLLRLWSNMEINHVLHTLYLY